MWRSAKKRRKLDRKRAELEQRCADLVGETLTAVSYVEGDHAEPMWNVHEEYDSVDHGVELAVSSGRMFAFQWDYAVVDFGMNLVEGRTTVIEGVPRHDVTTSSRWSHLTDRRITGCRALWKPDEDDDYVDSLPQTIRLDFEGDRLVFLTASEFDAGFDFGADHVSVFFDDAWQRRSDLTSRAHPSLD